MNQSLRLSTILVFVFVGVTAILFMIFENQINLLFERYTILMIIVGIFYFGAIPLLIFLIPLLPMFLKRSWLLKRGLPAKARVVGLEYANVTVNDKPVIIYLLSVTSDTGSEYDAVTEKMITGRTIPKANDIVSVLYDPNRPTDVIIV
jgi:hypothetical protein